MHIVDQVNAEFKRILQQTDPQAQMTQLRQRMKEKEMEMHGKPFPTFLKPYFVAAEDYDYFANATRLMSSMIEKISKAYLEGYDFGNLVKLKGRIHELAKIDPVYPSRQVIQRLDVFYVPQTGDMMFIEFNCGDPSGMGWHDAMVDIFLDLPVIKELQKKFNLKVYKLLESHCQVLLRKYGQYCEAKGITPKEKPTIAIVCWKDSTIRGDVNLVVEFYNKKGYEAYFADPADFDYDGKELRLNGKKIDIIYRDAIDDFIKDQFWPNVQAAIQAYRDGNVCFVNPISAAAGDFKALLAVLTDRKYWELFDEEEKAAIEKHIPWTRFVEECKTDFHGEQIDLVPFIRKNKDRFVLKPNEGYGGFGIVLGFEATQQEWEEAIDKGLSPDNPYSVQEKVQIPVDEFPEVDDEGRLVGFEGKKVNINFWSHDGRFAGPFVRAAAGNIINVHQGGGLVPVFFVGA
jgi:hypothetical protein